MYKKPHLLRRSSQAGFTLVEMIISVGLFAVVMVVCVSALLALVNANRKTQALQSVMNNLNIALDGMVRSIREGTGYNGSILCSGNPGGGANDCTAGTTSFSFNPYCDSSVSSCIPPPVLIYAYDAASKSIERSENGQAAVTLTAPEVSIDEMHFYVAGTTRGDSVQPKVIIVIKGTAGVPGTSARTTFHIQATAVQRVLDL